MLKGHLPRVIYHQVYWYTKITFGVVPSLLESGTLDEIRAVNPDAAYGRNLTSHTPKSRTLHGNLRILKYTR